MTILSTFPIRLRRPRLFAIGLPILVAGLVAWNLDGPGAKTKGTAQIRSEAGPVGHATIAVAEVPITAGLTFALLGRWDYQGQDGPPCPGEILAHQNRQAALTGFMYPLSVGDQIQVFCLLRSTQTCCFGPRPQFNQYLLVETATPVRYERLRPVTVSGRFTVDPQPDQGYIYRFAEAQVEPMAGASADIDAAAYAAEHRLHHWNWSRLAGLATSQATSLPAELLALDGVEAVVDGYVHDRVDGQEPQLVLGRHAPIGVPGGRTPTLEDAMTIRPALGQVLPPDWQPRAVWHGRLQVITDPRRWEDTGIVQLDQARACGAPASAPGRLLWLQAVIVVVFILATWGRRSISIRTV